MKFEKHPPPQSYENPELGISLKHCQRYSLTDENDLNGNFYCTKKQSIGQFSQTQILIEKKASILSFRYNIKTIPSNQIIGKLSISTLTLRKSLRAAIEIFNQSSYKWKVSKSNKGFSIFSGKTWSRFYAELFNDTEHASFQWDYSKQQVYKYSLESLPVSGTIDLSNPKNHILMFVGMFLMEMELQLKAID